MVVYGLFESPRELIEKFVCEHCRPPMLTKTRWLWVDIHDPCGFVYTVVFYV